MAKEHENCPKDELQGCTSKQLMCEHRMDSEVPHFALGLCEACYKDFEKVFTGLGVGLKSFDTHEHWCAMREIMKKNILSSKFPEIKNASNDRFTNHKEDLPANVPESIGANVDDQEVDMDLLEAKEASDFETLSDIDDEELDGYLLDEEEQHIKKLVWEKVNQQYLDQVDHDRLQL